MLRKSKSKPQTVAEKVGKLLAHPNDSESEDASDADVATAPRVVEFEPEEYDLPDARSTEFRKRNVKLLSEQSERYKGKIASRKELEQEDSEAGSSDDDDDEQLAYEESDSDEEEQSTAMQSFSKKLKANQTAEQSESESEEMDEDAEEEDDSDDDEDEDDEQTDDDESAVDDDDDEEEDEAIEPHDIMSKTNQQAEIQKGFCVQNQLRIWERLLELRINTQKITSKANQLPPPETLQTLSAENAPLQAVLSEAQERSSKLLQQLLALQSALSQQYSELRQSVKRQLPPTEDNSEEPPSKRHAEMLHSNFQQMRAYRNEVLLKWDDRTKLLTPGAGAKRKSLQEDYDIIKKINSALASREALVEKSQLAKSNQEKAAEGAIAQRQPHIYDDSDFYHQQLRELIEYKASTSSNMSEITKQFVELQKLRQKMKKKVDTRASKGRKLRYVVHNKLINFMAPNETCDWTDGSKAELYKSLFV